MQFEKIHNKGQARLFENPILEALTKTHPLVIWGMYLPILSWMVYHAASANDFSIARIFSVWLIGLFSWTLFEYVAHRFLFHMMPDSDTGKRIAYVLHGNHHHYPRD
ncbi:MAG: fatty acid hydroxylase, partial [Chitinophagaceae bacterium]|nr:fatty acid hydroxylase [Chitinophagaceae bacterium]